MYKPWYICGICEAERRAQGFCSACRKAVTDWYGEITEADTVALMCEPTYKCRTFMCGGHVRIENTYCEPCYLAVGRLSWIGCDIRETEAVALMREYAA